MRKPKKTEIRGGYNRSIGEVNNKSLVLDSIQLFEAVGDYLNSSKRLDDWSNFKMKLREITTFND